MIKIVIQWEEEGGGGGEEGGNVPGAGRMNKGVIFVAIYIPIQAAAYGAEPNSFSFARDWIVPEIYGIVKLNGRPIRSYIANNAS